MVVGHVLGSVADLHACLRFLLFHVRAFFKCIKNNLIINVFLKNVLFNNKNNNFIMIETIVQDKTIFLHRDELIGTARTPSCPLFVQAAIRAKRNLHNVFCYVVGSGFVFAWVYHFSDR